jgi:cullin 1
MLRSEQKQEEDATNRVIEEDRKVLIQAIIVRIMKMRKQLRHQQLIGETMQLLANRFKPSGAIIKVWLLVFFTPISKVVKNDLFLQKSIELLIQKEYMKRDEESKDLYIYIA